MRIASVALLTLFAVTLIAQKKFADPAPPEVLKPGSADAPKPQDFDGRTFHTKPKPPASGAETQAWTRVFGPTHNMVSGETKLLHELPADGPPLVWEMETGSGYASPVIEGDRLVYIHRWGTREQVECLHPETGERYWTFSYATDFSDRYGYNNGPRASPVIDGDRVFTYGAQGKLHALRLRDGALLWKRDLLAEFDIPQDFFGVASTPLVLGDKVIVNVGAPGGPTVAAFDRETGRMLWGAGEEWGASYASPVPAEIHGKPRVMVFAGGESRPPTGGLLSIDPATGAVDFTFPWRSRTYESVNAATPIVVGDRVLISATYRTGAAMLQIRDDFTPRNVWTSDEFDLHWTTAIYEDGYFYAFAGRNEPDAGLMCVNAQTGETVWREVLEWEETVMTSGGERTLFESPFRGSILKVDDGFLALGEHGHLMWLDLSPKGVRILSKAKLFLARETWSPPVVSNGLLYVSQNYRSLDGVAPRLLCYDLRGK